MPLVLRDNQIKKAKYDASFNLLYVLKLSEEVLEETGITDSKRAIFRIWKWFKTSKLLIYMKKITGEKTWRAKHTDQLKIYSYKYFISNSDTNTLN